VAIGTSNFKGSPVNRRHNIAVGAASVNGTLIAPGEEFSLLKTLGDIDAAAGYKPELVIKGGKTLPEFGGGLCQIGTTAFRAATVWVVAALADCGVAGVAGDGVVLGRAEDQADGGVSPGCTRCAGA
jgi:hypothetical protein